MKTVEVIVEHAGKNLSAYIVGAPVITVGNDMKEIEDNMKEAIELYLEDNPNPCAVAPKHNKHPSALGSRIQGRFPK